MLVLKHQFVCFLYVLWGLFCSTSAFAATTAVQKVEVPFDFQGIVVYVALEGGFYGLETDTGEKYLPTEWEECFQQEGLRVKVRAKAIKGQMGFKMWGQPIEIITIVSTLCGFEADSMEPGAMHNNE